MRIEDVVERHPRLFHVTSAGNWSRIRAHGLLTTQQMLRTALLTGRRLDELLLSRREAPVELVHPVLGPLVIPDQRALDPRHLVPRLSGVDLVGWVRLLNERAFLWPDETHLDRVVGARANRGRELDVVVVDTAELILRSHDQVRLSPIVSGAAILPNASPRGPETFSSIEDFDLDAWRRKRGAADAITEFSVIGGVPDIAECVIDVRRVTGGREARRLAAV